MSSGFAAQDSEQGNKGDGEQEHEASLLSHLASAPIGMQLLLSAIHVRGQVSFSQSATPTGPTPCHRPESMAAAAPHQPSSKLDVRRLGPFPIIGQVGSLAYRLGLPSSMQIHPVFHVSLLESHVANTFPGRVVDIPPPT